MTENTLTAQPHHSIAHVRKLMETNHIHAIPIEGPRGDAAGIVSAKDLAADHKENSPVSRVMTERVYTIPTR